MSDAENVAAAEESTQPSENPERGHGKVSRLGVAVVVVLALVALFWPRSEVRKAADGKLLDHTDHEVFLNSRMAPVTLLHFWSTWCLPCLDEVPLIQQFADSLSSNENFSLVLIAVADDMEKVNDFLDDRREENLFDPDWKISKRYETRKLPETHLIVNGQITHTYVGVTDWTTAKNRRLVQEALASLP